MNLTVMTVLFLVIAVLVAIGIVAAVALPHLRGREDHDHDRLGAGDEQRHSSRTHRQR